MSPFDLIFDEDLAPADFLSDDARDWQTLLATAPQEDEE
jgi:hypothetical protein